MELNIWSGSYIWHSGLCNLYTLKNTFGFSQTKTSERKKGDKEK